MRSSFGTGGRFRTVFDPKSLRNYFGTLESKLCRALPFRSLNAIVDPTLKPAKCAASHSLGRLAQLVEHLVYTERQP